MLFPFSPNLISNKSDDNDEKVLNRAQSLVSSGNLVGTTYVF